eukprot:CAMPEP_0114522442 /NCGR_PEP_ID=MMETSP0109-20121206/20740_1 /TAXON_ID=29199 /ORGANISM="Chlorarachnion reptans, Strain CCCM449" /LENGTH=181 /DNA_ID=CAMNT_0001703651 /DNA_START=74 /DNA_END=620 /DNA_ORIENTATION=+
MSSYKGFQEGISLEYLRDEVRAFAQERDWDQFHTPRNLLLAMVGEVGELAEIFQWKGEVDPGVPKFSDKEREHLGEEISDVLIYLIRLADRCQIDMATAALKKLKKNAAKYPADKARGKSDKYTSYNDGKTDDAKRQEIESNSEGQGVNSSCKKSAQRETDNVQKLRGGETSTFSNDVLAT